MRQNTFYGYVQLVKITAQDDSQPIQLAMMSSSSNESQIERQWTLSTDSQSNSDYTFAIKPDRTEVFTYTELENT